MSNEITINPIEIFKLEDNSITDAETIRQIALWSIKFNDNSLNCKVKKELEFAGLYPHILKYDVEVAHRITKDGKSNLITASKLVQHYEEILKGNYQNILVTARQAGKTAAMKEAQENYQAELNLDKYEIMLSANKKSIYPVGHLHKFTNCIFDKNVGVAFFQIDKEWDLLWSRRFTGYFDKEKSEIYDGDYLENENVIYLVEWNRNQAGWWLEPIKFKLSSSKEVSDMIFEYSMSTQSLGNGYFKRDDLLKIGNKFENPEIEK